MHSRNRRWSIVLIVVALGLGSLASTTGCTSKTDPEPAPPAGTKNFTLKGKAR
jgi:hypothetical protein